MPPRKENDEEKTIQLFWFFPISARVINKIANKCTKITKLLEET